MEILVIGYLKRPKEAWNNPAKKVAVKASLRWRSGSVSKETISLSIVPITKDAVEVGPTARCLEQPRTEYNNGGTKLESDIIEFEQLVKFGISTLQLNT